MAKKWEWCLQACFVSHYDFTWFLPGILLILYPWVWYPGYLSWVWYPGWLWKTSPTEVLVGNIPPCWVMIRVWSTGRTEVRNWGAECWATNSANSCTGHCWWQWDEAIRWLSPTVVLQCKVLFSCCYFLGRISVLRLLLQMIWFNSVSLNNAFLSHPTLLLLILGLFVPPVRHSFISCKETCVSA